MPIAEAKQDVYTRLGARPDAVVRVAMDQPSTRRIVARSAEVPGYGWSAFEAAPLAHPVEVTRDRRRDGARPTGLVRGGRSTRRAGRSPWTASPGYGRLVDGGDLGDSYNYSRPARTPSSRRPSPSPCASTSGDRYAPGCASRPPTCGPITWRRPSQARVGEHRVDVDTDVEVRADEAVVRVTTTFVNPSGDHRLRVHLPLPEPARHSHAESAFTVVDPRV